MEKKNQKMTVIVGALLLVIGISFSYFLASILINGNGANTKVTTAVNIKGATINIEGTLDFDDVDILPGHKNVSSIKLTATGDNELVPYNLIWRGTNGLGTALNYTVYKTSSEIAVSANCTPQRKTIGGATAIYEECTITNEDKLGSVVAKGTIAQSATEAKTILAQDEFITAYSTGTIAYYYVVLEYPNLDEAQNNDIGKGFEGVVTVEESNASPDIDILAVYTSEDGVNYTETQDIPQSGYGLNTSKSTCSNGAVPLWNYEERYLITKNLTKSGTSCYLYFEKPKDASTIFAAIEKSDARAGEITADTEMDNNKLYSVSDGMYNGTSYIYAGTNPNNWLKFAGFYWRIIRINGDGTIRLIYNGTSATAIGAATQIGTRAYNTNYDDNAYVGFMYGETGAATYEAAHANTNNSTILGASNGSEAGSLNWWYKNNIANKEAIITDKIDTNGMFCNDRKVDKTAHSSYQGDGYGTSKTGYAPYGRLYSGGWKTSQTPSLSCSQANDIFSASGATKGNKKLTYPVALITSDEVVLAGGLGGIKARTFWLNTGQDYWTMSPNDYPNTNVFRVGSIGALSSPIVSSTFGVRPVINLRSDVKLTGNGTADSPYEVA